ncbi:MAG: acyltransferase [Gammaproteobacteria bacterium]
MLQMLLARLRKEPHLLIPALFAWLRGWWYRIKFFLQLKRFSAGRFFRVYGPLMISGPGSVSFGDNAVVVGNGIKPVTIRTLSPKAKVIFGDHQGLNGTSIQCIERVQFGNRCAIADAYITDSVGHSIAVDRRERSTTEESSRPVIIADNVWVSVQVVILDGVNIGENSVIAACSLVRGDVPANVMAAGNPLKIIRRLDEAEA